MDFERAQHYLLGRLERELPDGLLYHGIHHTRDDVLPAVERLAALAGIAGEDLTLLRTGALYHDAGYLEQYTHNEPLAARLAAETLPAFGYAAAHIAAIQGLILATQLPQSPQTFLEELLCDADLDSLGREDFLATSLNLRGELMQQGQLIPLPLWFERQYNFLSQHRYFTACAREIRDAGKRANLRLLEQQRALHPA